MPQKFLCLCLANSCGPSGREVSLFTLYRHLAADREAARVLEAGGYPVDQDLLDAIKLTERKQPIGGYEHYAGGQQSNPTSTEGQLGERAEFHVSISALTAAQLMFA